MCGNSQMIDNNISKQYMLLLFNALNEKPIKNKTNIMKMLYFISLNVPSKTLDPLEI